MTHPTPAKEPSGELEKAVEALEIAKEGLEPFADPQFLLTADNYASAESRAHGALVTIRQIEQNIANLKRHAQVTKEGA